MAGFADQIKQAHRAFNDRNFKEAARLALGVSASYVDHGTGQTLNNQEEFAGWQQGHVSMSSDIQIVDARYVEGGDIVVAHFSAVGTQDGPMAFFPPSNKQFRFDVCEVYTLGPGGNPVEAHGYSDAFGTLMQLGHIEAPSES